MRLNLLLNRHRKKNKDADNKDLDSIGKFAWTTPTMILIFLKNSINMFTPAHEIINEAAQEDDMKPMESIKFKLQNWFEFKSLLYDIYDNRIEYAPEINGAINTNYMGMEEHLICYFI